MLTTKRNAHALKRCISFVWLKLLVIATPVISAGVAWDEQRLVGDFSCYIFGQGIQRLIQGIKRAVVEPGITGHTFLYI
jgi:hypothetical protein